MDGLAFLPRSTVTVSSHGPARQRSIRTPIGCMGITVHAGHQATVRLRPAPAGHGIVFKRTDLGSTVSARFDTVVDTRLCTVLGNDGCRVGTVEHLLAACAGLALDNLLVEVDGPELPILDGSAEPWLFLLDCAGLADLDAERARLEILRPVRVDDGDAFAELRPGPAAGLDMALAIDFAARAIGAQALSFHLGADCFRRSLSRARTFAQRSEIEALRHAGLARGGSLHNAVVVDGATVLNPGGLRMADEFVRHKMLDAVGDLFLGGALHGRFTGHKSGHALNNQVLRALFADAANWRLHEPATVRLAA